MLRLIMSEAGEEPASCPFILPGATMIPLTRNTGQFIAEMRYESIAGQAIAMVRNGFTDCTAVTILGRDADVVRFCARSSAARQAARRACASAPGALPRRRRRS